MSYFYDRTAGEKIWHDVNNELPGKFCHEVLKEKGL